MIATALLGMLYLYPWSAGGSAYYATGDYSGGSTYQSTAGYVSLDRGYKDLLAIGYSQTKISGSPSDYSEDAILARTSLDVSDYIRPGVLTGSLKGKLTASGLFKDAAYLDGTMLGLRIDGATSWMGYSVSQTYSEWRNRLFSPNTNSISRQTTASLYRYGSWWSVGLKYDKVNLDGNGFNYGALSIGITPMEWWGVIGRVGIGKVRDRIDWDLLSVDVNPDPLVLSASAGVNLRIFGPFSCSASFVERWYQPEVSGVTYPKYTLKYWIFGVQARM